MRGIPKIILDRLQKLEPEASFSGVLPKIRSSSGSLYYIKLGSPSEAEQYAGEAESLKVICSAAPGLAPKSLAFEVLEDGVPLFISEYKDIGSLSSSAADVLARRLATELHSADSIPSSEKFGFEIATYCGATRLSNGIFDRWDECYSAMIGDLLSQLERRGKYEILRRKGEVVKEEVIPKLLGSLKVHPVVLHGDLWSGNAGVDKATGQPVIFDPASYYGHNEADLSIARIFGGFPQSFFDKYHECLPKSEPVGQYNLRMDLYELFHYLNHTLLFGGHYGSSAEKKMDTLIRALPTL